MCLTVWAAFFPLVSDSFALFTFLGPLQKSDCPASWHFFVAHFCSVFWNYFQLCPSLLEAQTKIISSRDKFDARLFIFYSNIKRSQLPPAATQNSPIAFQHKPKEINWFFFLIHKDKVIKLQPFCVFSCVTVVWVGQGVLSWRGEELCPQTPWSLFSSK